MTLGTGAPPQAATDGNGAADDTVGQLRARIAELEREREHLVAAVAILQDISNARHFSEMVYAITRKLGEAFGLDRCSIYLAGDREDVRLVASFEDASIRNLVVDLDRYPELRQAFESGETVYIPDAAAEPMLSAAHEVLAGRGVRAIVVVPIRSRGATIGAIFLRTERGAAPFSPEDIRFCQVVASLTAQALRNAHQSEALVRGAEARDADARRADARRVALLGFVRRLLAAHEAAEDDLLGEARLVAGADEELDRLVDVATQVLADQARR